MTRPDCYTCKFRGPIPGDAHSECRHPAASIQAGIWFMAKALGDLASPEPPTEVSTTVSVDPPLDIAFHAIGLRRGWATWPLRFDPTWLTACNGWQAKASPEPSE